MAEAITTEQTPEVSVEDRIADMLDFPGQEQSEAEAPEALDAEIGDAPEAEESDAPDEESMVQVEFNGQTYDVPPELKDALMRESDYTVKTTDLANTRKAVELQQREMAISQQRQQFEQSVAEHVDQLKMLQAYIKHVNQSTDWANLSSDQIVRQKLEIDQLKEQQNELQSTLQNAWNEFQAKADGERKKILADQDKELSKAIPKWSEAKPAIEKYVQSLGYPEAAVQHMSLLDYQVAHKAMQFDQLKAKASSTVRKATDKQGKVITPSSRKAMDKETKSFLNYRKQLSKATTVKERSRLAEQRAGDKLEKLFR